MFKKSKKIKELEKRIEKLEKAQTVKSYRYGNVTLFDLMRIVEDMQGKG